MPNPVFEGDTIHSRSEVLSKRESHSRPEAGIVTVLTTGVNQNDVVVMTFKRTVLVYKRGHGPGQRAEPGSPDERASTLAETPRPGQPRRPVTSYG
jgi:hypothetical protein